MNDIDNENLVLGRNNKLVYDMDSLDIGLLTGNFAGKKEGTNTYQQGDMDGYMEKEDIVYSKKHVGN